MGEGGKEEKGGKEGERARLCGWRRRQGKSNGEKRKVKRWLEMAERGREIWARGGEEEKKESRQAGGRQADGR